MSAFGERCGLVAAGLVLHRAVPDLSDRAHPVAWFGSAMAAVERVTWRDARWAGSVYHAAGIALGLAAGRLVASPTAVLMIAVGGRQLRATATSIAGLADAGDVHGARRRLPMLVGRDPSSLDESGISAAVIESLAENTVDATIAPVVWALAAGGPGAAVHRAVNTMDALVGHRHARYARFGWASARADDVANWPAARLTAALMALVTPVRAAEIGAMVRRDAPAHPSPNAGVAEAAMAAALGRELGGPLRYGDRVEDRPTLGSGPRPDPSDIHRAVAVVNRLEWATVALLLGVWWLDRCLTAATGPRP